MIPDSQTNFLYLADTLPKKFPAFFRNFEKVLNQHNISFDFLPNTKDVWAVDYMPIQITKDHFIQFVYNPDYLRDTIKWSKTISDVDAICHTINISPIKSTIVLDGGNVIRSKDKVIMTDRVFTENPSIKERDLIAALENIFQVDKIIFIPTDATDFTGHADGMLRFYDNNTVLINDYSKSNKLFQQRFRLSLYNAGLNYIEIPYNPYNNKSDDHANGIYINYLQMEQAVIIPTFGMKEDDIVVKQMERLFEGQAIATVNSNDIAFDGGILNCISWNVLK